MGDFFGAALRLILGLAGAACLVGGTALVAWVRWGPGIDMTPERRLIEFLPLYAAAASMLIMSLAAFAAAKQP